MLLDRLTKGDLDDLRSSGLNDDTIRECGFYSGDARVVSRILGTDMSQGGLVIPYPDLLGRGPGYERVKPHRSDADGRNGRAKYLSPRGAGNRVYVPPTLERGVLVSPEQPLLVTEGEKKAVKAVQEGLACIALSGVHAFIERVEAPNAPAPHGRGRRRAPDPGSADGSDRPPRVIPDLRRLAWAGRRVFIVYDSDAVTKEAVRKAEIEIAFVLAQLDAQVVLIRLPPAADGSKQGLDDFLINEGPGRLRQLMVEALQPPELFRATEGGFAIAYGRTGKIEATPVPGAEGLDPLTRKFLKAREQAKGVVALADFSAWVVEERVVDNGASEERRVVVRGLTSRGRLLPQVSVLARDFPAMWWIEEVWGTAAIVRGGRGVRDQLREAIQRAGPPPTVRRIYGHTGWRQVDGRPRYLHAGSVAPEVSLPSRLAQYALPGSVTDAADAVWSSARLLEIMDPAIAYPLLAATYLAPLCRWLEPSFAVFLVGETGSLKSTVLALFLSHFGQFAFDSLPMSWQSTSNAIEYQLFLLKDVLAVVDDLAPPTDRRTKAEQDAKFERVIRSIGNRSGRARLDASMTARPEYYPRGMVCTSGERLPDCPKSIYGRMLVLEARRDAVDLEALSRAQASTTPLQASMAAYTDFLSHQQPEAFGADLVARHLDLRRQLRADLGHLRTLDAIAQLTLGLEVFTRFAQECGAFTTSDARRLLDDSVRVLHRAGERQTAQLAEFDPVDQFLDTVSTVLAQGTCFLDGLEQGVPPLFCTRGDLIGWHDRVYAYLLPQAAHHTVTCFHRASADVFPLSDRDIGRMLRDRGVTVCDPDRSTKRKRTPRGNKRVLQIPLDKLGVEFPGIDQPAHRQIAAESLLGSEARMTAPTEPVAA